jgi:hypothetical protein
MPDATQDLILDELRALRGDLNSFARETGERVSALETDMHGLCGNGQPGRVSVLETAVASLAQWRWWTVGVAAGASGVITALAWVISEVKK